MTELKKALTSVRRRIRLIRAFDALQWGCAVAVLAAALWLAVSFFVPIERLGYWLLVTVLPIVPVVLLVSLLWPVPLDRAARRADACGLKERAITALCGSGDSPMEQLQYADACARLNELDARSSIPLNWRFKPLVAAGALVLAIGVMLLVPNPQRSVLAQLSDHRSAMENAAEQLEDAAKALEQADEEEPEIPDLTRLLTDLAKDLRKSDDRREALTALSQAQQELKRIEKEANPALADAMNSLDQAGMDALAAAIESGDSEAIEEALEELAQEGEQGEGASETSAAAQSLSEAAQAAAQAGDSSLSSALSAAAQAVRSGNAEAMNQAGTQLASASASSSSAQVSNISALLSTIKSNTSGQGSGQGSGSGSGSGDGQGSGSGSGSGSGQGSSQGGGTGAGTGSTNEDAGYSSGGGGNPSGINTKDNNTYKTGEYEAIYDPTRLGDGGSVSQSTGEVGEGESMQVDLAPGVGDLSDSVPYNQVIGDYAQSAVQAADYENLPAFAKEWVNNYFGALTD